MFKDILREQQPVVYHTLRNALEHNRLAHAYMFSGPSGTPKKETAYLLAQSLVCRESGFACEVCDTCERIAHNEYADMIYLDGTSVSIKKDDILKLQHAFDLKRMGFDTWVRIGLTAAVNIFIGLIVILNPFSTVAWLMRLVGIGFLFSGVTDLITTIYVSKKASEYYVDGKAEEMDEKIK